MRLSPPAGTTRRLGVAGLGRPLLVLALALALGGALAAGIVVAQPGTSGTPGEAREVDGITVLAAASLTDVLPALDTGPSYSFAGSNALATQIEHGAPADVFLSANGSFPASLHEQGLVERPVTFARNELVIVVPARNPAGIESIDDLARPGTKVVVAGASVPVGGYTIQALKALRLAGTIEPNIVSRETNVRGVLAKIRRGQGDAGFVYATDASTMKAGVKVIDVPSRAQPKVAYSLAVVSDSPHKLAARAYVDEVLSRSGQAVFRSFGFLPAARAN